MQQHNLFSAIAEVSPIFQPAKPSPTATAARVQEIIKHMQEKKIKVTRANIITQSLFTPGGTVTEQDRELIDRQIGQVELTETIRRKFTHLSNRELVTRINGLPDFKWDDEGHELQRRIKASNGTFAAEMQGSRIVILKDEQI